MGTKWIGVLSLLFLSTQVSAWNNLGHALVAQIAWDNLTPSAQDRVKKLSTVLADYYQTNNISLLANWPDWLKANGVHAYDTWHYINQPVWIGKGITPPLPSPPVPNVVWAINQSLLVLNQSTHQYYPKETLFEQGQFLFFLIHFVGDLHQPLHAASGFSADFPEGDAGGTLYPIRAGNIHTLHAYWDCGGGWLSLPLGMNKERKNWVKSMAVELENRYPEAYFNKQVNDLDPNDWARESKAIALKYTYTLEPNTVPSQHYHQMTIKITEERITLAGYRLAKILNHL